MVITKNGFLNVNNLCKVFPILFVFELFFGYSGKMITLHGVPIRQILFVGTFFSLYFYCLYYIFFNANTAFLKKNGKFNVEFPRLCFLDASFFIFLGSVIFFSTVIPLVNCLDLSLAKKEVFSSLLMLTLAFPLFYLVKIKEINFYKLHKYVYYLVFILSVLHVVLYIGQEINSGFIYRYFFFLNTILGKTSTFPVIMLGHMGVPRVFFTTSIFLLMGVYFSLKKLQNFKLFDHIYLAVNILAIVSTMTKSLWVGVLIGLLVYAVFYFNYSKKIGKIELFKKFLVLIAEIFTIIIVSNYTVFNSRVFHHFNNSFVYERDDSDYKDKLSEEFKERIRKKFKNNSSAYHDREGSVVSNNIKIKQIQLLLRKWTKKPIFGYGYGSYVEDFIRSDEAPFSYEMVFFALLMKTGILGILCWFLFALSLIYVKCKYSKKNKEDFFCFLFLSFAFCVMVQTNPLIFNSVGIAFLLFISMDAMSSFAPYSLLNKKEAESKELFNKENDIKNTEEIKA